MTEFTDDQKLQAGTLKAEIESFIHLNRLHKVSLESNFVEIGDRLATVRTGRYWLMWGFKTFGKFMDSLESRTQNYHCLGVARDLLQYVSKADLVEMGISKATALRLLVKGGKPVTAEIVVMAKEKTEEELKGAVAKELGLVEDEEPGTWFSYGGARLADDEREEFLRTMNTVIRSAEIGSEEITNWQETPSRRKKEIIHLLCAEFLSSYATAA